MIMEKENLNEWLNCPSLQIYSIKIHQDKNIISVFITDCQQIWAEKIPVESFMNRCSDRGISGNVKIILTELIRMVKSSEESHEFDPDTGTLSLRKRLQGGSNARISLKFTLDLLTSKDFYLHVTLPLLATNWKLKANNEQLTSLLVAKDAEIAEYKASNSINIARKNLITEPFHPEELNQKQVPENLLFNPASQLSHLQDNQQFMKKLEDLNIMQPEIRVEQTEQPTIEPVPDLIGAAAATAVSVKKVKQEKITPRLVNIPRPRKRVL